MGLNRELHVINAVVIGGTSLQGGRATILGTLLGALIFGTLSNGMNQLGVNSNGVIMTGLIILGAAALIVVDPHGGQMRLVCVALPAVLAGCEAGQPQQDRVPALDVAGRALPEGPSLLRGSGARAQGLSTLTLSADSDSARQLAQVEDVRARGTRVLVIQPTDSAAAAGYVSRAHDAGAKVIAYDRAIGADIYVAHDMPDRRDPGGARRSPRPAARATTCCSTASPATASPARSRAASTTP